MADECNKIFFINDCYKGMFMRLLYCVFFFYASILPASEYIYPVASLNDRETILCIYQYSPTNIELLSLHTQTQKTEQILWSVFNPAGLQMLPDDSGFSFIDNGRLRIKSFQKRSAKSIDFDEPLYGINSLHWIDNHSCYCSAMYNNNFALFELHDNGTLQCLRSTEGKDFMYPQKIDDQLFYIERCVTKHNPRHSIVSCAYTKNNEDSTHSNIITDFNNRPIIFLTMISHAQGFVLEHAQQVNSENPTTSFTYHQIIKEGDIWNQKALFSFSIPVNLLLNGEERLYESILPLLPRIIENQIYFVDCENNQNYILEPYVYDLSTATVKKINVEQHKWHCFVPFVYGNTLYCGGNRLTSLLT